MKRVLLTGMSGTGKSTMIRALEALGYRAVDLDEGWCERDAEGAWLWRDERVSELLADETVDTLFVSGCSDNQVDYYPLFDHIVLLTAPADVLMERLLDRTNNDYGKRPEELAEVLHYLETVEPRLRRGASHEIETTAPVREVLDALLTVVGERSATEINSELLRPGD